MIESKSFSALSGIAVALGAIHSASELRAACLQPRSRCPGRSKRRLCWPGAAGCQPLTRPRLPGCPSPPWAVRAVGLLLVACGAKSLGYLRLYAFVIGLVSLAEVSASALFIAPQTQQRIIDAINPPADIRSL